MVYAYDNWAQLPVKDLYDSGIMQMAISAAKDMYDRGLKQMEDFYTKYGDFTSPFAKDMEWYGELIDTVRNVVDQAYANGIDLFKSPEGRMLVAKLSHSVDPKTYNTMRENAKIGYAYLDAAQKLRSQGKYSEALELFDIAQSRGVNFSDFSTIDPNTGSIRTWNRTSPIEATTLRDLTFDSYKGRTARDLTAEDLAAAGIPYDKRYRYTGYLDSDLMKVAPGASLALAGDPRAAFFRDQARQKVVARGEEPTAAAVEAQFERDIADANKWALIDPTKSADEYTLAGYKAALDRETHRQNAAIDALYKQLGDPSPNGGLPTPLDRMIKYDVNNKVLSAMAVGNDPDPRTRISNVNKIIQFYQSKMDEIERTKGRKVQDGFEDVQEPARMSIAGYNPTMAMSGYSQSTYSAKTTKKPKYRYEYDSSKDKTYQYYKSRVEFYKAHPEGFTNPLSKIEQDRLNLIINIASSRNLTDHELKVYKYLVEKRDKQYNNYISDYQRAFGNESATGDEFFKANDRFYGTFEYQPQDEAGVKVALNMFTKYTQPREFSNLKGKYGVVDFSQPGIEYAPIRKAQVSGPRRFRYNSLQAKFGRFLNSGSVEGIMINTSAHFASVPKEYSRYGASQIDAIANPSISKDDFMRFISTLPKDVRNLGIEEIARQLGLNPRSIDGTILNENKDGYRKATYYDVPSIATINNDGFQFSQMNVLYDNYRYGGSKSFETTPNSEASSLTPYINNN